MAFTLRRSTLDADSIERLDLARVHGQVARARRGTIHWADFDPARYPKAAVADAAESWRTRAIQEFHSLALFTQLASQLHVLGAPLDWSGAFARMIADEVRHTELCARFAELLGAQPVTIEARELHLASTSSSLRAHVRQTVVAAFCIGETLSGRMFRRCLRAATVLLAKDVVRAIVDDETFHGRFGWEAGALLMRDDRAEFSRERDELVHTLPELFVHYRHICGADPGSSWAHAEPEADPDPNFGTLTSAGYARAFYDGMMEDVIPGLVAIGLPEAEGAWARLVGPPPGAPT